MKKQFAIIGLGYFGRTIALELTRLGNDVLVIDIQEKIINDIADQVTHAVIADASDEKVLRELNLQQYDAAVVAIGENIEASLLCTLNIKSLGIKEIWVKAVNTQHHKLLIKLGASRIIHPEHEMGLRIAQSLNYPMVETYFDLGHNQYVVDLIIQENMVGKSIKQFLETYQCEVLVLTMKRNDRLLKNVDDQLILIPDDRLILAGGYSELRKISGFT